MNYENHYLSKTKKENVLQPKKKGLILLCFISPLNCDDTKW